MRKVSTIKKKNNGNKGTMINHINFSLSTISPNIHRNSLIPRKSISNNAISPEIVNPISSKSTWLYVPPSGGVYRPASTSPREGKSKLSLNPPCAAESQQPGPSPPPQTNWNISTLTSIFLFSGRLRKIGCSTSYLHTPLP